MRFCASDFVVVETKEGVYEVRLCSSVVKDSPAIVSFACKGCAELYLDNFQLACENKALLDDIAALENERRITEWGLSARVKRLAEVERQLEIVRCELKQAEIELKQAEIKIKTRTYPQVPTEPVVIVGCDTCPDASGIYFVWKDGQVAYVGQSSSLRKRVRTGHTNIYRGEEVSWLEFPLNELLYAESYYIAICRPSRNGTKQRKVLCN